MLSNIRVLHFTGLSHLLPTLVDARAFNIQCLMRAITRCIQYLMSQRQELSSEPHIHLQILRSSGMTLSSDINKLLDQPGRWTNILCHQIRFYDSIPSPVIDNICQLFWFRWAALSTIITGLIVAYLNNYLPLSLFYRRWSSPFSLHFLYQTQP